MFWGKILQFWWKSKKSGTPLFSAVLPTEAKQRGEKEEKSKQSSKFGKIQKSLWFNFPHQIHLGSLQIIEANRGQNTILVHNWLSDLRKYFSLFIFQFSINNALNIIHFCTWTLTFNVEFPLIYREALLFPNKIMK